MTRLFLAALARVANAAAAANALAIPIMVKIMNNEGLKESKKYREMA
jgi:hypothetical protein